MEGKIDPKKILQYHAVLLSVRKEIGKIVVGQDSAITALIVGLLANGHMLVEGIPGIAKTLLLRALARTTGCEFSRIQFTVDLLPTDITGITAYSPQKGFYVVKGPIFANFLLADEINRAPAKTQGALLEAMQEKQTTIGKETFPMMEPFFVMATQNPIETSGSLTLDQSVFVNGKLKTGNELLNNVLNKKPILSDGNINLYDMGNSWTFSLNENGKLEKKGCYFYTLPYKDEAVKVKTKTGREIKVTKNHPFLVNENGIIKWKKAEDLVLNEYLVSIRKVPKFEGVKEDIMSHMEVLRVLEKNYPVIYHEDVLKLKKKSYNFTDFSSFTGKDFDVLRISVKIIEEEL